MKKIWKTLVFCLAIAIFMSTIQIHLAHANYSTLYLSCDKDNFYTSSRKTTGSFTYQSRTYPYEIASSVQYWSFNHYDTSYSSVGTIRAGGAAEVINPSGYPKLGVIKLTVELTLHPVHGYWYWFWWKEKTLQNGEINIREGHLATISLRIQNPGDQTLRNIVQVAMDALYASLGLPFNPMSIAYALVPSGSDKELHAGPKDGHPHAHITGRGGGSYSASLAYDFLYTYYKDGASGWKSYELGIKISVDFGYTKQYRDGEMTVYVTNKKFDQRWTMYVYW